MTTIETITLGKTSPHPSQMRTVYSLEKLAELTFQMWTRGFDPDKPILLRQNGRKKTYEVVRGHRRRMCWAMTQLLKELGEKGDAITLDTVLEQWKATSGQHERIEDTAEYLVKKYAETELPAVIQKMTEQESLASLWSDQYGDEDPDIVGESLSYLAGIRAGYSPRAIAGHIGRTEAYVEHRIGLGTLYEDSPEVVSRLLAENAISIAPSLAKLAKPQRDGVGLFLQSMPRGTIVAGRVIRAIKSLTDWQGFNEPLTTDTPTARNIIRSLATIWRNVVAKNEANAWKAVFAYAYASDGLNMDVPAQVNLDIVKSWIIAFGLDAANWMQVLTDNLEEVSCETCPVYQLPDQFLKVDLRTPKLPCRFPGARGNVARCMHGLAPGDAFMVRLPPSWASYPGAKSVDSNPLPFAASYDDLLAAYTHAAEVERTADLEAEELARKEAEKRVQAAAKQKKAEENARKEAAAAKKQPKATKTAIAPSPEPKPEPQPVATEPETPEHVRQIAAYIELHEKENGANHFMATPCSRCAHNTQTGDIPCAWFMNDPKANPMRFTRLTAVGTDFSIPVCHQFAPADSPAETLYSVPVIAELPRMVILGRLRRWVNNLDSDSMAARNYVPFRWLTGRAMTPTAPGVALNRVLSLLDKGDLTDTQLTAVYLLFDVEWQRTEPVWKNSQMYVPVNKELIGWEEMIEREWDLLGGRDE